MPVTGVNPMAAQALDMQRQQAAQARVMSTPPAFTGAPGGGGATRPGAAGMPRSIGDPGGFTEGGPPMQNQGRPQMPRAIAGGGPGSMAPPQPPPLGNDTGAFSPVGLNARMARGDNIYMGGLPSAPGAGRPRMPTPTFQDTGNPGMQEALQRRIQQYGLENQQHQAATRRRGG